VSLHPLKEGFAAKKRISLVLILVWLKPRVVVESRQPVVDVGQVERHANFSFFSQKPRVVEESRQPVVECGKKRSGYEFFWSAVKVRLWKMGVTVLRDGQSP
jgi:hypothetical protein